LGYVWLGFGLKDGPAQFTGKIYSEILTVSGTARRPYSSIFIISVTVQL